MTKQPMLTSKETVITKIKAALLHKIPQPYPDLPVNTSDLYIPDNKTLLAKFIKEFNLLQGNVVTVGNHAELAKKLEELLIEKNWSGISANDYSLIQDFGLANFPFINFYYSENSQAGVTSCDYLIARTGTVVMSTSRAHGRILSVHAPVHIVLAKANQLTYDLTDAFASMENQYGKQLPSAIIFASGPSRTGDIEKTLVLGVHGPVEVYIFILEEPNA
jgi:L-lactate dehydrogenase complex protein LldG